MLSQQHDEAGGSLSRGTPGRVGAAPTTPGRFGTARRAGFGKQDQKVERRVNQWVKPRKKSAGSKLVDMGRGAARDPRVGGCGSTPKPSEAVGGEATLKGCGVGVAMLSG